MTLIVSLKTKHWPLERVASYGFLVGGGSYIGVIWLTCALFVLSLLPMVFVEGHLPASTSKP